MYSDDNNGTIYTDSSVDKDSLTTSEELIESIKRSVSVMLSYGEASDIIPVGVFRVSKFIDFSSKPYKEGIGSPQTTLVELKRVDLEEGYLQSPGEKLYIPVVNFIDIYPSLIAQKNSSKLHCDYGVETYLETLLALEDVISKRIKTKDFNDFSDISVVNAEHKTLDDLNATYVNAQGELMGNNYSIMPYSLGMVLRKTLVKTMDPPEEEYGRSRGRGR